MEMSQKRLDEIKDRESKACSGPWFYTWKDCKHYMSSSFIDRAGDDIGVGLVTGDINQHNADLYATDEDMEFIAHARVDIPELIDEVERLRCREGFYKEFVRATEWIFPDQPEESGELPYCPMCGNQKPSGHKEWCAVPKLLEERK
jgi:hypothetical protein